MSVFKQFPSIEVSSTTTGTGNFTVSATAGKGRQPFSARYSTGDRFIYRIDHALQDEWEIGVGTLQSATVFSRSPRWSSNSDALVNFSAGDKVVSVTQDPIYDEPLVIPKGADISDASQDLTFSEASPRREMPVATANRILDLASTGMGSTLDKIVFRLVISRTGAFTITIRDKDSAATLFTVPASKQRLVDCYWDDAAATWMFSGQLPLASKQ